MQHLEPQEVFSQFAAITQIPRPSKKEGRIMEYLRQFAAKHNLACKTDAADNVLISKPATPGYEDKPGIVLQAHTDMVCEKNADTVHNFDTDPIQTYVDGDWLKAKGTTLGADNGIGMAIALAVLASNELKHPAIECLFTVDEETGLTGAFALGEGFFEGSRLINLDSEDDGEIFIGCAGGIDTLAKFTIEEEEAPQGYFAARVKVSGLLGGHSGDDIEKGRGNANKILVRYLYQVNKETDLRIAHIDGGNLRNAIAREAYADVCVPMAYKEQLRVQLNHFTAMIESELALTDAGVSLSLDSQEMPARVFTKSFSDRVLQVLYACPHGVFAMSRTMPGLVETSTNMASVKRQDDQLVVNTSQRSSMESAKYDIMYMVETAFLLGGAEVSHGDGYPGWQPNVDSHLLKVAQDTYRRLEGKEAKVRAIHAGLECGLFLKKYPHLDMISVGPTMTGVHSPNERLSISSTATCWKWIKAILEEA